MKRKMLKVWNTIKKFKEYDKTPNRLPTQKDLFTIFVRNSNWKKETLKDILENLFVGVDYENRVLFLRVKRKKDKKLLEAKRWYEKKFYNVQYLPENFEKKVEKIEEEAKLHFIIYLSRYNINNPFRKGERWLARSSLVDGSREKVRRILRDLEEEGFIYTEKGENKKKVITFRGLKEEREEIKKKAQNRLEELEKEEKFKKLNEWVTKAYHQEGECVTKDQIEKLKEEDFFSFLKGIGLTKRPSNGNEYWRIRINYNSKTQNTDYEGCFGNVEKVSREEAKTEAIKFILNNPKKFGIECVTKNFPKLTLEKVRKRRKEGSHHLE